MTEPTFDIFKGTLDLPEWIEAVEGLSNARERMLQVAAEKPGKYFIFSVASRSTVAVIETLAKSDQTLKTEGSRTAAASGTLKSTP